MTNHEPSPIDFLHGRSLLLASHSPRRRELLAMLDFPFEIAESIEVDETYSPEMPVEEVPAYLSQKKGDAYCSHLKDGEIVITADTVVIIDGMILGKPKDDADAIAMLHTLQGKTQTVVTGVSLTDSTHRRTFSVSTEVTFAPLTDEEISYYVSRYRPLDKAGAYGIQEWIGAIGIEGIRGSFYNVMGLPVHRLYEELKAFIR
ncbi:Maf family nucleotide pyrophosphatase [uncultured Muribaculum sp.]|uniref:Maf family nucleotide pyrophosphatase n=1 Tax=uncultured Muribaculum sp. TaxID=1918613 RepID=UPI0025E261DF|nr:Maf family nucleotide pyrophosphatase [uncultured Muribaculum sp.]